MALPGNTPKTAVTTRPSYADLGLRWPQRQQGIERFSKLLDAAETLLETDSNDAVNLGLVAQVARVPLPSVYHFFANRDALFIALAMRHLERLDRVQSQPLITAPTSWQDLFLIRQRTGVGYLNAHPAALRLFMGAGVSAEVRMIDLNGNLASAHKRAAELNQYFVCDALVDLPELCATTIALSDGIWSASWGAAGRITDNAVMTSHRAVVAYLRCFLPEALPLRRAAPKPGLS